MHDSGCLTILTCSKHNGLHAFCNMQQLLARSPLLGRISQHLHFHLHLRTLLTALENSTDGLTDHLQLYMLATAFERSTHGLIDS